MTWWKNLVVYQIYPRSFQDSNGDGIGDIPGIIKRLDYLQTLGVNAVWLSPVYESPNDDNGYDISNYEAIHPEYGTMDDMNNLIAEADKRNIRIIMDQVVNHTSDEHPWFQEAIRDKTSKYRDYYIWRDPVNGREPNDLKSAFGGSAWEYDEKSGQYYLHIFSRKQPDLNWENKEMRQDIYKMMNFWLDKGIGGFRMDVIDLLGKDPDQKITGNGPKLHDFLKEMHQKTFGNYDVMTVGESWVLTPETAPLFADEGRNELNMMFQFEHLMIDELPETSKWDLKKLDLIELKQVFNKWQTGIPDTTWNSLFWDNHDTPRIVSRYGNDKKYRVESAKMLAILLHLMKGTPYIYQGEEIGMTNLVINHISEVQDIESYRLYHEKLAQGWTEEQIIEAINTKGRDNARTPMQWADSAKGGFTIGTPWMKVNSNIQEINVEEALKDENSVFYTYQKLIQLRKEHTVVIDGEFKMMLLDHPKIFAYERQNSDTTWLIVANFSDQETKLSLSDKEQIVEVIISNSDKKAYNLKELNLSPYETFVVEK
ncbi:glycoside hydrolase family 13 protein [Marinilactibacillus psychrotolerans]|uniref:Oligo-1,6-glucosidase n=1 Tax=Marinilactibacillus psychrotolerans TaxID=191770 RepID=A0AAV3WUM4_9LACT|nr:alpha-glucosidase [Marinilactibacillus psychrotolerans]GEL68002.1 alpha-glucosidase [Marinilactibacillus psychrotolerans]GEQ36585.1 oligo-1,6-glucosidase [Marinilactibacillus psychrotolerans]SDD31577.1 glucan 1,6-alpha-glucosidase [Marinilactibacillus psychrotolerans]